ncbi:hypothetical protein [Sphingomonas sp. KC8]|uniref:hypothetical protein n=1 Tax=Sphingomonas sp. KC8 TaxID=1030157 RepID=UPI0002489BBC|nr:hypothetical protein [Sphingomonas sp. KC8]ARS29117.1 hypothetical protein KC8_17745 [Sphingomonas sp. KC8]
MMRRMKEAADKRVALLIDGLREAIEADLPAGVQAEAVEDGDALPGRGLARALAFDGRLRGFGTRIGRRA